MKNLTVKQHANVSGILMMTGMVIEVIGAYFSDPLHVHFILWMGVAVLGASMLYRVLFVRCPHCGDRFIGLRTFPEFCPQCGKKMDE